MKGVDNTQLALIGVISLIGIVVYFDIKNGVKETAKAVTTAINPTDQNNLVNKGVTAVGKAISGKESWSLGTAIYDWTHPDEPPKIAPLKR